ncbi:hypothetical protein L5515_001791 [Caenorhabditis briggsae]|uniref:Serine/threonine-protein phosphatase n=1 Tax=Caenorhabditis briggsae TaxID=6238 RepID=A0AAE9J4Q0_CAEBR|nr:hypothetical protein L5515_001791 [Caenorhabditis briggsae]
MQMPTTKKEKTECTETASNTNLVSTRTRSTTMLTDEDKEKEKELTRQAYSILMRVLESGKHPDYQLPQVIPVEECIDFAGKVGTVFNKQATLIEISAPINICGDIHGQFCDLLRLFDKNGFPHRANYLFLGDYVDRGRYCLETILLLFAYKAIFPNHFFLLRGNHECPNINKIYGFYDEIQRRYNNLAVWEAFQSAFTHMPLAALVGGKILCMHGGISEKLTSLQDIRNIIRPIYNPDVDSLAIDILWSDPTNFSNYWSPNTRGVSVTFGKCALWKALKTLDIDMVVRAHQVVQDGYEFFGNKRLVTIFSAPFYCGQFDNAAAVLNVAPNLICSFVVLRPKKKISRRRLMPAK